MVKERKCHIYHKYFTPISSLSRSKYCSDKCRKMKHKYSYKKWANKPDVMVYRKEYTNNYNNRVYVKEQRKIQRKIKLKEIKLDIFTHYCNGVPHCQCPKCNETRIEFLTIDHVNGGGNEHRRKIGEGTTFYQWLKKHNYPEGFRVLCWNCNCGRQCNNGICPHMN